MKQPDLSFDQRCYALLRKIPKGKVTTYKAIANALDSKAYQAVGNAMKKNPNPIDVPCHRVVNSDGRTGGYVFGRAKKEMLLTQEGIVIAQGKVQDLEAVLFTYERERKA